MRREMLEALKALAIGNIKKAKMNIEIYLVNPEKIGNTGRWAGLAILKNIKYRSTGWAGWAGLAA